MECGATIVQALLTHTFRPDGAPDCIYYQNRAHTRGNYAWRGIVHELGGSKNPAKEKVVQSSKFQVHHHQDAGKPRNYTLLLECQTIEDPKSTRYAYYYGRGLWYDGRYKEAIAEMTRYLALPNPDHVGYRSEAMRTIAESYERRNGA
jgi:hypothetical protein